MKCSYCGTENPDDARFCRKCGKSVQSQTSTVDEQPSQIDYNVVISCITAKKQSYVEIKTGEIQVKLFDGEVKQLKFPIGDNTLFFHMNPAGFTLLDKSNNYKRELNIQEGEVYYIEVGIGRSTNRINIHT